MGNPAPRPKHLAAKLLEIRRSLGLSQPKMVQRLGCFGSFGSSLSYHRISEYESARRMPSLMVLLAYARAANIPLESIVDDEIAFPES
jgi:transcriptional regulator with XRE-family HTH domain